MEEIVKKYMRENHILDNVRDIVLAVSGGADSMALAHFMLTFFPEYRYTVAHLHHGLRAESDNDEALVKAFAEKHGVPFRCLHLDIAALAKARKQGIEETGREERYRFFRTLDADLILTAHHKNDTVETVLLHLMRGSGLKGVCGILPRENDIGRPFLCVTKAELLAYCAKNEIVFTEDSSNDDTTYTRNKIRHELLPLMETINPDVVDAIYRFSVIAAADESALEHAARRYLALFEKAEGETFVLEREGFEKMHPALAQRVLRAAACRCGAVMDYEMTRRVLALTEGKKLPVTTNLWVRVEGNRFLFVPEKESEVKPLKIALPVPGSVHVRDLGLAVKTYFSTTERKGSPLDKGIFPIELLRDQPLLLRYREHGDKIELSGHKTKKLSDYFIDEKVPASARDKQLLVAVGDRVLWIVGRRFFVSPGENNLVVEFDFENYSIN